MKLLDLMRQAGVQWPEDAEYAAQDGDDGLLCFYSEMPKLSANLEDVWGHHGIMESPSRELDQVAEDWETPCSAAQWFVFNDGENLRATIARHTSPEYMKQQAEAARRATERKAMVRELMLRHPSMSGEQAVARAEEILCSTSS